MRLGGAVLAAAGAALALAGPAGAHGDEVPTSELAGAWEVPAAVVAPAAVALLLFLQGFLRLRLRGRRDHAPLWRLGAFALGLALAVLALLSPLDAVAEEYLLSAHMLQHVLIGDAAAALVLLSISGPLLFFLLPAPVLGPLARLRPLRALLAFLSKPFVAFCLWAALIGVWHVPALYEAALRDQGVHDLEHVCLVLAGVLMWYQLIDPARRGQLSRAGRLGLAVAMFAAGQVLSSALAFAGRILYAPYGLQDERLLGLSALTDQRLAAGVMMAEQAIALGAFAAFLLLAADQEARAAEELPPVPAAPPRP